MKITNIETFLVFGGRRNFSFVVVDTDEGIYGVGENGLGSRELAVKGAVEHLKKFLIGRDPFQIERLCAFLPRQPQSRGQRSKPVPGHRNRRPAGEQEG